MSRYSASFDFGFPWVRYLPALRRDLPEWHRPYFLANRCQPSIEVPPPMYLRFKTPSRLPGIYLVPIADIAQLHQLAELGSIAAEDHDTVRTLGADFSSDPGDFSRGMDPRLKFLNWITENTYPTELERNLMRSGRVSMDLWSSDWVLPWAICDEQRNPVGVEKFSKSPGKPEGDLSIWVARFARGRGAGPLAMAGMVHAMLTHTDTRVIQASNYRENGEMAKRLQDLGFRGGASSVEPDSTKEMRDRKIWGVSADEWEVVMPDLGIEVRELPRGNLQLVNGQLTQVKGALLEGLSPVFEVKK